MQRIKWIVLKNFKFFYGEVPLELDRKNTLIYGENGSGKSSIYWALYTFMQCVFKATPQEVRKYFNSMHPQNLINRFADGSDIPEGEQLSSIKVVFEDEHLSESTELISGGPIGAKNAQIVKQAAVGSEFINYRLLSHIHDFKNSEQIDLFKIVDKDVLMFIHFRRQIQKHDGTLGNNVAQDWWEYLKPGMQPRSKMHESPYRNFQAAVNTFNVELKFYLESIIESVNEYLRKLKQDYSVSFEYIPCVYDPFEQGSTTKRVHKTFAPKILLRAHSKHQKLAKERRGIERVHTYFNEAKLTAIALSIRFAMLDHNLGTSRLSDDTPKILVMDDLLLSLDMSNRDIVLDIILGADFYKYQLLILTHDRNFFELIRHKVQRINQDGWKYIEMYECEKKGIPQPLIFESNSYLGNAEKYLQEKRYEIAGNFLRKEAENFCKKFLPERLKLGEFGQIKPLAILLQEAITFARQNNINSNVLEDLDSYRKFLLNDSSHDSYDVPKYKVEIEKCIDTLKELGKLSFQSVLNKGELLEFELTTSPNVEPNKAGTYKFEITIQDDFRLIKEDGKESILSKGLINYRIFKNGVLLPVKNAEKGDTYNHSVESLKKMYDTNYAQSDRTKSENFWDEVTIVPTGMKLKEKRIF